MRGLSSQLLGLPAVLAVAVVAAALAVAPSSTPASSTSSGNPAAGTSPPIRLQAPHPERTPPQRLREIAQVLEERGVDRWDVYGDFLLRPAATATAAGSQSGPEPGFDGDDDDGSPGGRGGSLSAPPSFLRDFEAELAQQLGMEDAVFMPSGGMAQSIALLIHHANRTGQPQEVMTDGRRIVAVSSSFPPPAKAFACHPTSHLLIHEQRGYEELCGFAPQLVPSKYESAPGRGLHAPPLLYEHLVKEGDGGWDNGDGDALLLLGDDVSTIIVELPHRELGGKLTPWSDILKIRRRLDAFDGRKRKIALHCDGARLFESSAGYSRPLAELARPFDSVYISFYKGLGGFSGAMLLGSAEFCREARIWLRRFGGNLYTVLPYAASAWVGYQRHWKLRRIPRRTLGPAGDGGGDGEGDDVTSSPTLPGRPPQDLMSFVQKKEKLVRIARALSSATDSFAKVATFEPPVPEVGMVHLYLRPSLEVCNRVRDQVEETLGVSLFHRIRALDREDDETARLEGYKCMLELSVGQANGAIPDETWIGSWVEFSKLALEEAAGGDQQ